MITAQQNQQEEERLTFNTYPVNWTNKDCLFLAKEKGHAEVLRWLARNGFEIPVAQNLKSS